MTIAERESRNSEMVSDLMGAIDRHKMTADAATDAYSLQPAPISSAPAPARFKRKYRRVDGGRGAPELFQRRSGEDTHLIRRGSYESHSVFLRWGSVNLFKSAAFMQLISARKN